MKKAVIITLLILIIIIALTIIIIPKLVLTGKTIQTDNYSYTKAICTENKCRDYVVECDGKRLTKLTPTAHAIQQDNSWTDPRPDKELCGWV